MVVNNDSSRIFVALLALVALSCSAGQDSKLLKPGAAEKPDIVLIVVDDLNDWVGVMNGHPQSLTPNLDALAQQGILFTNAHANAPQCYPSRQSFLSGRYPKSTGIYFNNTKRPPFFGAQPMSGKTSNATDDPIFLHRHFLNNNYRVVSGGKITNFEKPDPDLDSYLPLQTTPDQEHTFTDDRKNLWVTAGRNCWKTKKQVTSRWHNGR